MIIIMFIILIMLFVILDRIDKIWYFLKHDTGRLGRKFRKYIGE